MKTTNSMEQLLSRGMEVVVKDVRLGDSYYEVDATYWGPNLNKDSEVLIKFEGHLLSVTPERVVFKNDSGFS